MNIQTDIYTYPENADTDTLAQYRAAVQRHHKAGGRVEYRSRLDPDAGWEEPVGSPCWSWDTDDYRAVRPPVDIHTYPTDPSLLPAYQIAVMRAHHEQRMDVEVNYPLGYEGWSVDNKPCWDWVNARFRIRRPKIAEGHNPDNLSEEQVGVKDGWRLLTKEEHAHLNSGRAVELGDLQHWQRFWHDGGSGAYNRITYRTRKPAGYFLPKPEKSVREKDEEAYHRWNTLETAYDNRLEVWLAARESLRKELGL